MDINMKTELIKLKTALVVLAMLSLVACSNNNSIDMTEKQEHKEMNDKRTADQKGKTKEAKDKVASEEKKGPKISTSTPKTSKSLSDAEVIPEGQNTGELYIVPNRFPEKDLIKPKEDSKDKEEKESDK